MGTNFWDTSICVVKLEGGTLNINLHGAPPTITSPQVAKGAKIDAGPAD